MNQNSKTPDFFYLEKSIWINAQESNYAAVSPILLWQNIISLEKN